MFSWLLIFALVYVIYTTVKSLLAHEGAFGAAQYAMVALVVVCVPLTVFSVIRAIRKYKEGAPEREEALRRQQEELAQRKRRFYLEEEDDAGETADEDSDETEILEDPEDEGYSDAPVDPFIGEAPDIDLDNEFEAEVVSEDTPEEEE